MGSGNYRVDEAVKVVIISTQYVETDALSFKSVVQRLTGKDSTVAAPAVSDSAAVEQPKFQSGNEASACGINVVPVLEDLDGMFKDLPPLDELYWLFAE